LIRAARIGEPPSIRTTEQLGEGPLRTKLEECGLLPAAKADVPLLVADICEHWLADVRGRCAKKTHRSYAATCGKLLDFTGPTYPLSKFNRACVDGFANQLRQSTLSDASIKTHLRQLRALAKYAAEKDWIDAISFKGLRVGSVATSTKRRTFIDDDVTTLVLGYCPDAETRVWFALMRFGGLRCPSETLALQWSDLGDDGWMHVPDKKRRRLRPVPIVPELQAEFDRLRKEVPDAAGRVITFSEHNRHRRFKAILAAAGISLWPKLFQTLRRSRESSWRREGIPAHVVSKWVGHSKVVGDEHYDDNEQYWASKLTGRDGCTKMCTNASRNVAEVDGRSGPSLDGESQVSPAKTAKNPSAPRRTRTFDPLIKSQLLYQLS